MTHHTFIWYLAIAKAMTTKDESGPTTAALIKQPATTLRSLPADPILLTREEHVEVVEVGAEHGQS